MKLNSNELEKISGGHIIESKDKKFFVIDQIISFDNEEDAKRYEELSKKLINAKKTMNSYLMSYDPTDWDSYLHHKFNMKLYEERIQQLNEEIGKLKNKNRNKTWFWVSFIKFK